MVVTNSIPESISEEINFSKKYMIKVAEQATKAKREQFIDILNQYNIPISSQIELKLRKHDKEWKEEEEEEDNEEY